MSKKNRKNSAFSALAPVAALGAIIILSCVFMQSFFNRAESASPDYSVAITEVMTKNTRTLEDDFGAFSDWIELKNTGDAPVDLSGWMLMGDRDSSAAFIFSGEALQPGDVALIFASGHSQTRPGYVYHAPFKLSASGDAISLYDAGGRVVDSVSVPAMDADYAYALGSDGEWSISAVPTPGLDNGETIETASSAVLTGASLRLNELMADNATYDLGDGCVCDYIELYNDSPQTLRLDGYSLTDTETNPQKYLLDGLSIPGYGCLLIHLDGVGNRSAHAGFGLNADGEEALLYNPEGKLIDSVSFSLLAADQALSLVNGEWVTGCAPTPGLPNTTDSAIQISRLFEEKNTTGLTINEICFSNTSDVDGHNSYDWIELRNTSSATVSLAGYGLSDDPSSPRKWQFPEGASIKSGGYLVVMLTGNDISGVDRYGYYQADFRLSGGESVTLCTPDGVVLDRVPAMQQYGDISCGRQDGQAGFFYFENPTIGAYNSDTGYRSRCQKPVFSVSGGLYESGAALNVEISAEPDALIFYTLDCTEPDSSSLVYSGPISVTGTTIIRAVAYRKGSIDSYTATESYLFGLDHGLRVVSLVSDPDNLFSRSTGIIANELKKWERPANVEIYASDGSVIQSSHGCGIALNGDASRRLDMKSFRVLGRTCYDEDNTFTSDLFSGRDYDGYRSFLLRGGGQDNTRALIRDPFIDSLASATEVMYQESEMCVLYLNGEFYGVYDIRERISTYSICDFEGWEQTKNMDIVKGNDLAQHGSNADYTDILQWIKANPTPTDENIAYLETRIDLDNYIDYMCFMVYSANQDIGVRRYRSEETDGKWRWIVFDQDFGFYNDTDSISRWLDPAGAGAYKTVENKLFSYLMKNDQVVDRYLSRFGELLADAWAPDTLLSQFDALVDTIRPEMPLHCEKWSQTLSLTRWESQIATMRSRISERSEKIIGYLSSYFDLSADEQNRYFGEALKRAGQTTP